MNKTNFKGLRTKMMLALMLGMALLFVILFFAARTVLYDGYSKLEKDKTNIQINSAVSLLNEQSSQLNDSVRDNAHWDDIYQYMHKQNPAFIESSFADSSLTNLKVNAILIINNKGDVLLKKSLNYRDGKLWRIPEFIMQEVKEGGAFIDPSKDSQSGLFWTQQGICIVSAFNILDSQEKGPRRGTLIMVRLLDEPLLQHYGEILGTKLSVEAMRDDEIAFLSPNLTKGEKVVIPISDKRVAGFSVIEPIAGDTKLVLGTQSDRKIFEQGQSSLKFLYGALLMILLLLAAFSMLLDKLVMKRLSYLSDNVKRIGESANMHGRINELGGQDEMATLAQGINRMLEHLDESQFALIFEKERAEVTLAGIADAVITSDPAGYVLYMNTTAARLTGVDANEAVGKSLQSLFHLMNEDKAEPITSDWLIDTASGFDEVILERVDGVSFIITKSTSPLYARDGVLFGYVTVLHDVTMLRSLSNQLSYQARHDALTGLVNRYEFDRKTHEAIEDAANEGRMHCIAYLDLDQFKIVNDTCGHAAGDQLLRQLADHLKTKVRNSDTLARLGGDEFALLLIGCPLDRAQKLLENMLEAIQEFRFSYDDKMFKVGASIGLVEVSPNQQQTLSEVVNMADSACYKAKKDGGNRVYSHQFDNNDLEEHSNQLEWVSRIHLALEQQQFVLYSQRMQSLGLNQELHCELLIRMRGNDGTLYPPSFFLPAAERYHLMPKIDRWVVAEALKIMARKGDDFTYVSAINLSGQTLSEEGFLAYVIEQIEQKGVDARRICFEITETAVIANLDKARNLISGLRKIGCRFSLDDFGSGLSSFAYLKNLEVDFLKIDGMFVKAIVNNKIDRAMVESINNVGHVMGLHTIAEFVENDEIMHVLKEIGVDYAQGFGVAKPELFE